MFDEGVEAVVGLLTQPSTTFAGRYVQLTDARCEPKPVQQPHPPITIGGRGKTRTLRTTARFAQQWNAITKDTEDWADLKQTLLAHCTELGRDPAEITCSVNIRLDSDSAADLDAAIETTRQYRDAGADLAVVGLPLGASPAFLEPLADRLAALT
jgi:alkanesulfonate monooxygenase SsuD/methylene tetrahydromethanopterin reductase-like flavin-dependent oxidoreductase (luciferase family)